MKTIGYLILIQSIGMTGCLPVRPNNNPPQITQLQARAFQTRKYEDLDQKTVIKTVLNVLQDEGFLVHYGDMDLGLLSASKELVEIQSTSFYEQFISLISSPFSPNYGISVIDATANISEFGKQIKVRLNFQRKIIFNNQYFTAEQINDQKFYQEFFVKVDKGLFIQKEDL